MNKQLDLVQRVRIFASVVLISLSILLLVFALISGSEAYGEGVSAIVQNSPNATPWAILLVVSIIGLKRPIFGGFLTFMIGLGMFFFFNFGVNFFLSTFIISLIIPFLGFLILMCGYYIKKAKDHE